ncbi:LOW QUALITY PROTEIN: homologous recombination OB-fold protein [Fundulus heteroclitus]|uniref:LOW QUALITY PROTEIN: homologous recombination OB-fold protein n=1 Tax=Fundulus heteroclitus TaxID=8078 RepID=UPI00165BFA7C|nr:LOW QUALITY PROTEIN: homologous recombination OB-fold protein [Fundulus heteroclitus]
MKTSKLSGLFSLDEDFDDEDVLGTDWTACSVPGPADVEAAAPSCALRASSVSHREQEDACRGPAGEKAAGLRNYAASGSSMLSGAAQTVALGLRQLSSSTVPASPLLSTVNNSKPQQSPANTEGPGRPSTAQDDFDDWDVDLADLDECDEQTRQRSEPAASSVKTLRPSAHVRSHTPPDMSPREPAAASRTSSRCSYNAPPRSLPAAHLQSPSPRAALPAAPPRTPAARLAAASTSGPPRTPSCPQRLQNPRAAPQAPCQARGLFSTVSPAPSPSLDASGLSPHPLHTPVLTNRLVQLVSASSRLPKRPRSESHQPRTRRFPGPAGLLPQQPQGQNLDEIVVSVPHTPTHGAVARPPSQCPSSQSDEEEFSGRAWAAMKAETGLDERNPSCFLHTYSVVMVLRKAALKRLPRNKVPNMAVLLKSIIHTNADAKAVFKDPTGEIQGTVHRRLLEERSEELKAGAILLLKQVGVFSPSHRNHYLNVTPNNLLRIYSPDGVSLSTQLPPLALEPAMSSPARAPDVPREPLSRMQLELDDEGKRAEGCAEGAKGSQVQTPAQDNKSVNSSRGLRESFGTPAPQDADWDADDDLDELLGEIPEDTYSF